MSAKKLLPWGIIGINNNKDLSLLTQFKIFDSINSDEERATPLACERLNPKEIFNLESQDMVFESVLSFAQTLPTKKLILLWITLGTGLIGQEELIKNVTDSYRPSILKKLKRILGNLLNNATTKDAKPIVKKTDDIKENYQQVIKAIKYFIECENYDEESFRSLMRMYLKDETSKNIMLEFLSYSSKNKDLLA